MSKALALQRHDNRYVGTMEWYTPPWLLERIVAFYGGNYLDPCPASSGVVRENGLTGNWRGQSVYVNPPYGKPIKSWIIKAMTEPCREVILLVPAYTETAWFAPLYAHTLCFIRGRVQFLKRGVLPTNAPHPSVLVYRGRRYRQFAEAFADLGPILRTYRPKRDAQPALLEVFA